MASTIIYFVCESGMATSAMGATLLRKRLHGSGIDAIVKTCRISDLPDQAEWIIGATTLINRYMTKKNEYVHSIDRLLDPVAYDDILNSLQKKEGNR